ncbi:hypothetical protein [Sulfurimonas sp.]|uniref:hypothetical protein n=1 Tax=Sulfurimonas sp. TaxID=2022749 RepID=UPI0025E48EEC|nr:hypothetical protein [Sulfurimonas sp.]
MEQIPQIIAVFSSQMALVFFKHINIRVIVAKQVEKAMFYTFLIQASWLISSAIGINAFIGGNYIVVIFYLAAGVLGTWLNFKIKV